MPDQSLPLTPDPTPPEEGRRLDEVFGSGRRSSSWRRMVHACTCHIHPHTKVAKVFHSVGLHLTHALDMFGCLLDCLTRRQVDRFRADFVFAEHHGCDYGALNVSEPGTKKLLQPKETIRKQTNERKCKEAKRSKSHHHPPSSRAPVVTSLAYYCNMYSYVFAVYENACFLQ